MASSTPRRSLDLVEGVDTPDARTVVVRWKAPFIEADSLFTSGFALPLPQHLLAQPLAEDKSRFNSLPYWRDGYVGVGPYLLQDWLPGSHLTLVANDSYLLGRPKIDEIEIRLFTDLNAFIANILAGAVEKPIGRGLRIEHALDIRDRGDQMRVALGDKMGNVLPTYPQFIGTNPPILADVQFCRALLHAINRAELNETINFSLGAVADSWLQSDTPEYPSVASRIIRYEYSPSRAGDMIQALGYTRGSNGVFQDASGQPLSIQLRTTEQNTIQVRAAFPMADYWKQIGVDVETLVVPNQLIPDREYRSTFPSFELVSSGHSVKSSAVRQYHSSSTPLPATRFQGANRARYQNPELDSIIERYVTTIPITQRLSLLGDMLNLQTSQLTMLPLFFQASATVLGAARLKNVTSGKVWNAHLWDLD